VIKGAVRPNIDICCLEYLLYMLTCSLLSEPLFEVSCINEQLGTDCLHTHKAIATVISFVAHTIIS
jgi:hypothetical protein